MKINLYSIKDTKIGYEPPFARENDELAKRDFLAAATYGPIEQNRFKQSPADYELYKVGSFDKDTGKLINSDTTFICNLIGVKNGD